MKNLLLITFDNARYGLWEDAITAVREALPLLRLPLSPPAVAGIAVLDDRSAVLADLAACLGYHAIRTTQNGTFLIVDPEEAGGAGVRPGLMQGPFHDAPDGGPAELVRRYDLPCQGRYCDACHLCDAARRALRTRFPDALTPDQMYGVRSPG